MDFRKNAVKKTSNYTSTAKIFHWLIAFFVITLLVLGWYMTSIKPQSASHWYVDLHKSLGLLVGILILLRIIWRLTHPPASLPASVSLLERKASRLTHLLLYFLLFLMPFTGFMGSSFGKFGVAFFGYKLPMWAQPNSIISEPLFSSHNFLAYVLAGLIVIHILAALKHLFINKDQIFQRMWW